MDEDFRKLTRRTLTDADAVKLVSYNLRLGKLKLEAVELASKYGHPIAVAAVGKRGKFKSSYVRYWKKALEFLTVEDVAFIAYRILGDIGITGKEHRIRLFALMLLEKLDQGYEAAWEFFIAESSPIPYYDIQDIAFYEALGMIRDLLVSITGVSSSLTGTLFKRSDDVRKNAINHILKYKYNKLIGDALLNLL